LRDKMFTYVLASTVAFLLILTLTVVVFKPQNQESQQEEDRWMVCRAKFCVFSTCKDVTLYVAWTDKLMSEGYKFKDSYDFLNKSAVGILFIFTNKTYPIGITMKDVKLPLKAVFYTASYKNFMTEPVEEVGNKTKKVWLEYYAEKEYVINDKAIIAMIEYNPQAYKKLVSIITAHEIELDPSNCYLT